jgi:hypothetical protein
MRVYRVVWCGVVSGASPQVYNDLGQYPIHRVCVWPLSLPASVPPQLHCLRAVVARSGPAYLNLPRLLLLAADVGLLEGSERARAAPAAVGHLGASQGAAGLRRRPQRRAAGRVYRTAPRRQTRARTGDQ